MGSTKSKQSDQVEWDNVCEDMRTYSTYCLIVGETDRINLPTDPSVCKFICEEEDYKDLRNREYHDITVKESSYYVNINGVSTYKCRMQTPELTLLSMPEYGDQWTRIRSSNKLSVFKDTICTICHMAWLNKPHNVKHTERKQYVVRYVLPTGSSIRDVPDNTVFLEFADPLFVTSLQWIREIRSIAPVDPYTRHGDISKVFRVIWTLICCKNRGALQQLPSCLFRHICIELIGVYYKQARSNIIKYSKVQRR